MGATPSLRDGVIRRNLEKAIETMREAVADAERSIAGNRVPDPRTVLHAFTWGLANASSGIMAAMEWREKGHEETLFHAHRNPDPDFGTRSPEPKA